MKIGKREHQTPDYLAVNPLGKLPCLKVSGALYVSLKH